MSDAREPDRPQDENERKVGGDILVTMLRSVRVPLPDFFRPTFGGCFASCIDCARPLHDDETYLVIKHVRGDEPLYEFAICTDCMEALGTGYSDASRRHINAVFAERVSFRERFTQLREQGSDWRLWLERCIVSGRPRDEAKEYQVVATCAAGDLVLNAFPYAICDEGIELIESGISDATRGRWDRFVGDHLGLPPELRQLPVL